MKPDTETTEPTGKRRAAWWLVFVFVMVFVLYPLSIGPIAILVGWGYVPESAVFIVYWPLIKFCELTHTRKILEIYIGLCVAVANQ